MDFIYYAAAIVFLIGLSVVSVFSAKYERELDSPKIILISNLRNICFLVAVLFVIFRLFVPDISIVDYSGIAELKEPNRFFMEQNNHQMKSFYDAIDYLFFSLSLLAAMVGLMIQKYLKSEKKKD
jgi:ABC-type amino acid transport system permease subunit